MVKTRDLSKIKLHRDAWKPLHPKKLEKEIYGWDTETKNNGDTFLLTKSDANSDYSFDIRSFDDFLDITWNAKTIRAINFFYNLSFDIGSLVKYLGENCVRDLAETGYCLYKDYMIKSIPGKAFVVSKKTKAKRGSLKFYDALQFYKTSLKLAAGLVGEEKIEFETGKIDYNLFLTDKEYRERLITYAKQDAKICRKLGERLFIACNKIIPIYEFYSTASIAQSYFLAQLDGWLKPLPTKVMDIALQAYGGGRFELIKRGHFDNVYEIDINSAYPKEMSLLVKTDTDTGHWISVTDNHWNYDAIYGFYEIEVETHGYIVSPIMNRIKEVLTYPHGKHKTYVELSELKVIDKLGFKPKILKGYEYFDTNPIPLFNFINKLYDTRVQLKKEGKEDLQYVYKIIMNSAYGKTIQLVPNLETHDDMPIEITNAEDFNPLDVMEIENEEGQIVNIVKNGFIAGRMFNPVFAAAITGRTRARLLDTVIDYRLEKSLIGFATDCLFLKEKPPSSLTENNNFGDWKLEVDGAEGLFIGSGVYALRKEKKQINHIRGFRSKRDLFHDIIEKYIVTPEEQGILFEGISPVKLREGVRGGKRSTINGDINIDWRDIGRFIETKKVLDLNFDKKRKWEYDVKGPMDLLENEIDSLPLVI